MQRHRRLRVAGSNIHRGLSDWRTLCTLASLSCLAMARRKPLRSLSDCQYAATAGENFAFKPRNSASIADHDTLHFGAFLPFP